MSSFVGPEISNDDLIFYYDMNNIEKSWRGAPTTNLVNPAWSVWSVDGSGQGSIGTRTISNTYECTIVDINSNTRQSTFIESISASTTYTFSVQYKKLSGTPTLRFQIQAYNNDTYLTTMSFATTAQLGIENVNGWQTAKITLTTPSNTNRILWFMQDGDDYTTYTHSFMLKNVQCEQKSFATPFVAGTRSNTQSILDLTGTNTITASSLTYNSDGTFSFNGSSDVIRTSNNIFSGTDDFTICAMAKTTNSASTDYIFGNYNIGNNGAELYFFNSVVSQYIAGTYVNGTIPISSNQWYHIASTRLSGSVTIYVNGVLDVSGTASNSIPVSNPFTIGNGDDYTSEAFSGNISMIQVYNRALTFSEVQKNFNATRGRYGI